MEKPKLEKIKTMSKLIPILIIIIVFITACGAADGGMAAPQAPMVEAPAAELTAQGAYGGWDLEVSFDDFYM